MTFSIAAYCSITGQLGYSVVTSSVCVGARVGAILPGRCVVFSQARTDPRLHSVGLSAFETTGNGQAALDAMLDHATQDHWRQLGILDVTGEAHWHHGKSCLPWTGAAQGKTCLALGNYVASQEVLDEMVAVIARDEGSLAERLVMALAAGEAAGGERDPLQSAAVQVFGSHTFPLTDLRIDKSTDPVAELKALLLDWIPKADAYVTRALDPDSAPSSAIVEHGRSA